MTAQGSILVVGGRSQLALGLRQQVPDATFCVRGRPPTQGEIAIDHYFQSPVDRFSTIVNCIGTSTGRASDLRAVNYELPVELAKRAKAGGARAFIHISSFSVYGAAKSINAGTPVLPDSLYGHTKALADEALMQLADNRFTVSVVRFPAIIGPRAPGKFGMLVKLARRMRFVPVQASDVRRSMITYSSAAKFVGQTIAAPANRTALAADPVPFTFHLLARLFDESGLRLRLLQLPPSALIPFRSVAPRTYRSLFTSSLLHADANAFALNGGVSDIEAVMRRIVAGVIQ